MADYGEYVKESFADLSKSIRKSSRSVRNRIQSIVKDSQFVCEVSDRYGLPLIANERCGRWYVPPQKIQESVYFKSTDGHVNQWSFSTRRLNLHVIDTIAGSNGIIIVDSTRRGKRMPDALSKTVPIWCAVLNAMFFDMAELYTPPNAVSESEHSQIEALIPDFVAHLKGMNLDLEACRDKLKKPLRPLWVTPDQHLPEEVPHFEEFYPIVLCTASQMVQDGTLHEHGYTYVQGAADDHEEWAQLLTSDILWQQEELRSIDYSDSELHDMIKEYAQQQQQQSIPRASRPLNNVAPSNVSFGIGPLEAGADIIIDVSSQATPSRENRITHPLESGKKGSKELRAWLPTLVKQFNSLYSPTKSIAIVCDTGNDFSVGIALTLLCLYHSEEGMPLLQKSKLYLGKEGIRKRLARIIVQHKVNPSRATLNSINSFLMG
ncbi:tRNA A64-2'-O-ribosylphosphate transferase [Trichomonascus vanleenenianus]|uniref:tRNA A64-2'-O-ribosylphosphate transferase n=1 Tax=Trichomonascus vanleenenianus TaxID=2268995 RepID=UPI003ECB5DB3